MENVMYNHLQTTKHRELIVWKKLNSGSGTKTGRTVSPQPQVNYKQTITTQIQRTEHNSHYTFYDLHQKQALGKNQPRVKYGESVLEVNFALQSPPEESKEAKSDWQKCVSVAYSLKTTKLQNLYRWS